MTIEKMIAMTAELTGTELSARAIAMMVSDLSEYAAEDVTVALKRCRRECRYKLTLADIIERLPNQPLIGAAAWEIALRAELWLDRYKTIIVPLAIWVAFPHRLVALNDMYGARIAFCAAYPEALRLHGREVHLRIGLHETRNRQQIMQDAFMAGILPSANLKQLEDNHVR